MELKEDEMRSSDFEKCASKIALIVGCTGFGLLFGGYIGPLAGVALGVFATATAVALLIGFALFDM